MQYINIEKKSVIQPQLQCVTTPQLLFVESGILYFLMNGVQQCCSAGQGILLFVNTELEMIYQEHEQSEYYIISCCDVPQIPITFYFSDDLLLNLAHLQQLQYQPEQSARYQEQACFYEILSQLSRQAGHDMYAVCRYIDAHLTEPLQVRQLAENWQLSPYEFCQQFMQVIGDKPSTYITNQRIAKAKMYFIEGNLTVKEVARKVGFTDEYYFSRRFKQMTGQTPSQFIASAHSYRQVVDALDHVVDVPCTPKRVIYYGEAMADLLVLGIVPIGGDLEMVKKSRYKHYATMITDIGLSIDQSVCEQLQPDVILLAKFDETLYEQLSSIAPTVVIDTWLPLHERLHQLGYILNKKDAAEQWYYQFREKEQRAWQEVKRPLGTATAFIYERNKIYIMGCIGISQMIYHPEGFRATPFVQQLIDKGRGYAEVTAADVLTLAGETVFIIGQRHEVWHAIEKQQSVYYMDEAQWNYDDALTRERALIQITKVLDDMY